MFLSVCFLFLLYGTGSQSFQWTSAPVNISAMYVCAGDDLQLLWNFTLDAGDDITNIEWFYEGRSAELIAMYIHGSFVPTAVFTGRLQFVPGAGVVVKHVLPGDEGDYMVEVTGQNGSHYHFTERHILTVHIGDSVMTTDSELHAVQESQAMYNNVTGDWALVLSCGTFIYPSYPPFDVEWVLPNRTRVPSSSYQDGKFQLYLSGTVQGGSYTCNIKDSHAACVHGNNSHVVQASVTVDDVNARLTLLEAQMSAVVAQMSVLPALEKQLQALLAQQQVLQQEIHTLAANISGPCSPSVYHTVDDYRRHVDYTSTQDSLCDLTLKEGWYRFLINGSNAVIPTSCVPESHCGTTVPIYLELGGAQLPPVGQTIDVTAYGGLGGDCRWSSPPAVTVHNCGSYFVYMLRHTNGCPLSYCAQHAN